MIALLLALMLVILLYRMRTIGGRILLAVAFVVAVVVTPFVLQMIILHFGLIGFWSFVAVIGILAVVAFYQRTAGKKNA